MLTTIVASGTSWYLSMRHNLGDTEDKLEAQTIAISEWERLSHMSLDELEANRETLKTPYPAGTGSQYSLSVNLGQKGTFNDGTCGAVGSDGYANCFKDTTITVYQDGTRLFTTRTLPLMSGDYTRKEIDKMFADYQKQVDQKLITMEEKIKKEVPSFYTSRATGETCVGSFKQYITSETLHLAREGVDWNISTRLISKNTAGWSFECTSERSGSGTSSGVSSGGGNTGNS